MRKFLTPGWLALHVFTVAVVVTMILLGRWQLIVSDEKHFNLQNFGYAIQWWLFSGFSLYLWWRFVRDELHGGDRPDAELPETVAGDVAAPAGSVARPDPAPVYRGYVMPTAAHVADDAEDEMQSSYNAYLRGLHETASE